MTSEEIAALLAERQQVLVTPELAMQLAAYLDLLLRWNVRMNLSAIREPEEIVLRHFGESLQCAAALPAGIRTLLDYGSGAGFPGALCALARPALQVTLAESQGKKAAFLQELARTLPIQVAVHAGRVEAMAPSSIFDAVALRAVDRMQEACAGAVSRMRAGDWLVLLTTRTQLAELAPGLAGMAWVPPTPLRGSEQGVIAMARRLAR